MEEPLVLPLTDVVGRMIRTETRVRFTDCDAYGHVASSRYLEMAVDHRMSAVTEQLGFDTLHSARHDAFAMINKEAHLDFRAAAKFDDHLMIESWIDGIRRLRMTIKVRISLRDTGKVACMVTFTSVAIDLKSELPRAFPKTFAPLEGLDPRRLPWAPGHPVVEQGE